MKPTPIREEICRSHPEDTENWFEGVSPRVPSMKSRRCSVALKLVVSRELIRSSSERLTP